MNGKSLMRNITNIILGIGILAIAAFVYFNGPGQFRTGDDQSLTPAPGAEPLVLNTSSTSSSDRQTIYLQREPLQVMKNPYPDLSGVAVDPVRDEIILVTGQRASADHGLRPSHRYPG